MLSLVIVFLVISTASERLTQGLIYRQTTILRQYISQHPGKKSWLSTSPWRPLCKLRQSTMAIRWILQCTLSLFLLKISVREGESDRRRAASGTKRRLAHLILLTSAAKKHGCRRLKEFDNPRRIESRKIKFLKREEENFRIHRDAHKNQKVIDRSWA